MIFSLQDMLGGRRVILASKSPRRQELLKLLFDEFEIVPATGEEIIPEGADAMDVSRLLAVQKCREVSEKFPDDLVIGCDTTVIVGNEILGKPADEADAARMLGELSGTSHYVVSGACISFGGRERSFSQVTEVSFRKLADEEISAYIATGEPMDKAGAYGIQEKGSLLVREIKGDFFNVVGLPVSKLAAELELFLGGECSAVR